MRGAFTVSLPDPLMDLAATMADYCGLSLHDFMVLGIVTAVRDTTMKALADGQERKGRLAWLTKQNDDALHGLLDILGGLDEEGLRDEQD